MSQVVPRPVPVPARTSGKPRHTGELTRVLRTTDPQDIGLLYIGAAFGFFLAGGAMPC
jgi:hypothetical protein